MRGKLIVIEGNDCSGKNTQANILVEKLVNRKINAKHLSFPNYDTPTGKIVGACYLGQEELCKKYLKDADNGWFKEESTHVDEYVSSLYFAADRKYNIEEINHLLNRGVNVILDRYTFSNMAHQGGKITTQERRFQFFKKIEILEFEILELPRPDIVIFLHVPYNITIDLLKTRGLSLDDNEKSTVFLKRSEQTYLELRALYHFQMIECASNGKMRPLDEIGEEVLEKVLNILK